jgi:RNA polymerase sigma-70 factor (ECF subfamily)
VVQHNPSRTEEFIRLITLYQPRVYLFVLSLVHNRADADEVLQETNLVLWKRFAEFELGTDFRAWAFQIAFFKSRQFLDRSPRSRVQFGESFLETLASVASAESDRFDSRQEALVHCLEQLSEKDRQLIDARYQPDATVASVAQQLGRSTEAVYKGVQRLRRALHDCIQRKMSAEDRS